MTALESLLLTIHLDEPCITHVEAMLKPYGWQCLHASNMTVVPALLAGAQPAAILVDGRGNDSVTIVSTIRQLPAPINGTPVLTIGGENSGPMGAGGHLALPLEERPFLDLLRRWAGPLGDHALRRAPWNFHYRLIRLVGLGSANTTLQNLKTTLEHAIEATASDEGILSAHRLAGIAGMCGFPELSRLWTDVDRGEPDALAAALGASRDAIVELDLALRPDDRTR